MPGYCLREPAQSDLDDIESYYVSIANELIATQQIARLVYRFELLADYPLMGQGLSDRVSGLRKYTVPQSPFVILYYPRASYVEIARVIHGIQHMDRAIQ